MAKFIDSEKAVVTVRGIQLQDWETVWVQLRWGEAWDEFRFTMAERGPPTPWALLQFFPGDSCSITLGGYLAITGYIISRQVSYDSTNHAVQLWGATQTYFATKSSAYTKTNSFDGQTYGQIVRALFKPYPVTVVDKGIPNNEPLKQVQVQQGESNWDMAERLGRQLGVIISTNKDAEIILVWPHAGDGGGSLIEGVNILKCQAIGSMQHTKRRFFVPSQKAGSDESSGKEATQILGKAQSNVQAIESLQVTPSETPLQANPPADARAQQERKWADTSIFEAHVTVQGWENTTIVGGTGDLWRPGSVVNLVSPMIPWDGPMGIKSATFTQDSKSGTLTTLELWLPSRLNADGTSLSAPRQEVPSTPPDPTATPQLPLPGDDVRNDPGGTPQTPQNIFDEFPPPKTP
jgi:prophage tail gpP-like protein